MNIPNTMKKNASRCLVLMRSLAGLAGGTLAMLGGAVVASAI